MTVIQHWRRCWYEETCHGGGGSRKAREAVLADLQESLLTTATFRERALLW